MSHNPTRVRILSWLNSLLFSLLFAEQHGPTSSTLQLIPALVNKLHFAGRHVDKISSVCSRVLFLCSFLAPHVEGQQETLD